MEGLLEILAVMPAAFVMCLVLTGIHGYLGLHVLERKVIFVDLALAQFAALGGIVAIWLGYDPHHPSGHADHTLRLFAVLGLDWPAPGDGVMVYALSLAFALAGAAVFSLTRMRQERVPQEAFIGVAFATAIALALLLLERLGGGAEHVRNMLARDSLLFATWGEVGRTGLLYAGIGVVHFVFRRRFFEITLDADWAASRGVRVRLWDFLFYASFGLVITSSVQIAGVLLVFSYLVVPGAIAVLFADRVGARIALAWGTGFAVSVLGMLLCAVDNLEPPGSPPGPWIVACFAAALVAAGLVRGLRGAESRRRVLLLTGVGGLLVVAALGTLSLLAKAELHDHDAPADDPVIADLALPGAARLSAARAAASTADPHYAPALAAALASETEEATQLALVEALAAVGGPRAAPALATFAEGARDPGLRLAVARALGHLQDARALALVLGVLEDEARLPLDEAEALELLEAWTGEPAPTDPEALAALVSRLAALPEPPGFDPSSGRLRLPAP